MHARRPLLFPLVLLACTDRPLGETDSGSGSGSTSAATSTSTTTTTSPGPVTTGLPATVTSAGSSSDPSASASDTATRPDFLPDRPRPTGLTGCTLAAPPGTDVSGQTELGPFLAARAYFGVVAFDSPWQPVLLFVSPAADPAAEVVHANGDTGPVLYGNVSTDLLLDRGWLGTWSYPADLFADGQAAWAGGLTVTIDALAGNWDAPDPRDPPRLVGTLNGPIAGPFDAVYCDKLDQIVIVE